MDTTTTSNPNVQQRFRSTHDIDPLTGDANRVRRMILSVIPVSESRTGPYDPGLSHPFHDRLEDLVQTVSNILVRRRETQGIPVTVDDVMQHMRIDVLKALQEPGSMAAASDVQALAAYFKAMDDNAAATGMSSADVHGFTIMRLVRALTSMNDGCTPCPWMARA